VKSPEEQRVAGSREVVAVLRDVTMTYDGYQTRALTRVNLDFRRGEVVGVLGAEGAGKSTVLKILAGRLGPSEGTVKVFGRSPRRGSRTRVGFLPGKMDASRPPGFFRRLFAGKKDPSPPGRGVGRLAQAILGNRDLLVLDDPFEGLEPPEMSEARALVRDMAARGKTVILSSSSLMDVKDLCQSIVILHEGKVQAVGALEELLGAGGGIRFLPAVLPRRIVDRVLTMLREEILGEPVPERTAISTPKSSDASPAAPQKSEAKVPPADQLLTTLTKPAESAPPAPSAPKTSDPIDHGKLEELTRTKPK
jgi:ABC-2 type transport system ATP-binding protein